MNSTITMVSIPWILRNATASLDITARDEDGNLDWFAILAGKVSHAHFDKLADDIMAEGFTLPIVLVENGDDRYTIGNGHHRLSAAILLGLDEIPVILEADGDYWRMKDSHDGEWDCGDRSYEYWELMRQNFPIGYGGDTDNEEHRAQFAGYDNSYSEYNQAAQCERCDEYVGCATCHVCTPARCGECEYDEGECICETVTPQAMADDDYAYIFCQDCNGYGYRINHAACGLERAHAEALVVAAERRANGLDLAPGQWHPAYILEDAYGQQEEWLRDEPVRRARRDWETAVKRLRNACEDGVSDTLVSILAGNVSMRWDAWQAL